MATHSAFNRSHFASGGTGRTRGRPFLLQRVLATLGEMRRARRTRRLLAEMDDRMLADIGIGRGDALMEASRAPWDIGRDTGRH